MKVTIDLKDLTLEQAFELGRITAKQTLEVERPVQPKAPITRNRKSGNTNKFKSKTALPEPIIEEAVRMRKNGLTLEEIAERFNLRNWRTKSGRGFNSQSVWSAIYSQNARKYWGI